MLFDQHIIYLIPTYRAGLTPVIGSVQVTGSVQNRGLKSMHHANISVK